MLSCAKQIKEWAGFVQKAESKPLCLRRQIQNRTQEVASASGLLHWGSLIFQPITSHWPSSLAPTATKVPFDDVAKHLDFD